MAKAVIQRVSSSYVKTGGAITGEIGRGLNILLGIGKEDTPAALDALADKILNLRIFEDGGGKMNLSALDIKAELLVVSQFTLYGDCRKGRRPGFDMAAGPEKARELYDYFVGKIRESGLKTETGVFGAHMEVSIVNDGPVTFILEF